MLCYKKTPWEIIPLHWKKLSWVIKSSGNRKITEKKMIYEKKHDYVSTTKNVIGTISEGSKTYEQLYID